MAPKAKGAAKAKAKVVAKAKARLRVRGRGNMARPAALMRRPAGAEAAPGEDPPERVWERGAAVPLAQLPLHLIRAAKKIVIEEGSYFNAECKFAGMVEGIDLDAERGPFEVSYQSAQADLQGALLRLDMQPRGGWRRPVALEESAEDARGWCRGRLGLKPAESPPGRRRRRTPRFEAQGPGSARGHSEGRRPWSAQERRSEGEGFRDFRNEEKEEERQEEEEKGQEQEEGEGFERRRDRLERRRQVGWQPAQEGLRQEGALVVCWDGARSEGVRQGPGGSAGKKAYEEESRERQFQQQQQWQQSEHLGPRRGGGRDSVCPGVKSAGACGPLSGSTMLPGNRADEDDAAARSGPGRQTRDPATSSGGLLPSAAAALCLRAFPAGADDPDIGDRPPIERESSSSCGLADTASEKYRTYHGRLTLDCQPTPRDPARRASDPHSERRSLSGAKRALPGDEAAQPSSKSGGEARPKRGKVSDRGKGDYKGKG